MNQLTTYMILDSANQSLHDPSYGSLVQIKLAGDIQIRCPCQAQFQDGGNVWLFTPQAILQAFVFHRLLACREFSSSLDGGPRPGIFEGPLTPDIAFAGLHMSANDLDYLVPGNRDQVLAKLFMTGEVLRPPSFAEERRPYHLSDILGVIFLPQTLIHPSLDHSADVG